MPEPREPKARPIVGSSHFMAAENEVKEAKYRKARGAPPGMPLTLEACAVLLRADALATELTNEHRTESGLTPVEDPVADWLRKVADICEKPDGPQDKLPKQKRPKRVRRKRKPN